MAAYKIEDVYTNPTSLYHRLVSKFNSDDDIYTISDEINLYLFDCLTPKTNDRWNIVYLYDEDKENDYIGSDLILIYIPTSSSLDEPTSSSLDEPTIESSVNLKTFSSLIYNTINITGEDDKKMYVIWDITSANCETVKGNYDDGTCMLC
jgi:hypothetical protein